MLDILSIVTCETPTFSRKRFIVNSEACHHRMCSFLRTRRIAPSRSVRSSLIDLPTLKSNHEFGLSAPTAVSVQVRRMRCSRSGPRTFRGRPPSGTEGKSLSGSVPVLTALGPGPVNTPLGSPTVVPPEGAARGSPTVVPPGRAPSTPTSTPSAPRFSPDPELELDVVVPEPRCWASCLAISASAAAPSVSPRKVPGMRAVASLSIR